jgi:hypothetical protein
MAGASVALNERGGADAAVAAMEEGLSFCHQHGDEQNARDVEIAKWLLLAEQSNLEKAQCGLQAMLDKRRSDSDVHCALGYVYATSAVPNLELARDHLTKASRYSTFSSFPALPLRSFRRSFPFRSSLHPAPLRFPLPPSNREGGREGKGGVKHVTFFHKSGERGVRKDPSLIFLPFPIIFCVGPTLRPPFSSSPTCCFSSVP